MRFENRNLIKEKKMKKVSKTIAAIAVIFGSFVAGGNAAFAISLPSPDPIVIPDLGGPGPDIDIDLGSFDITLDPYFDTHCDDDDGEVLFVLENNFTDAGIISATRYVAVHVQYGDDDGWYPALGFMPSFLEMEGEDVYMDIFEEVPSGSTEVTFSVFISVKEPASVLERLDIVDEGPSWQKTVSVECSSDDPVETTEDTPEEVTEDTPEEVTEDTPEEVTEDTPEETEVDELIEGSPLFTG